MLLGKINNNYINNLTLKKAICTECSKRISNAIFYDNSGDQVRI